MEVLARGKKIRKSVLNTIFISYFVLCAGCEDSATRQQATFDVTITVAKLDVAVPPYPSVSYSPGKRMRERGRLLLEIWYFGIIINGEEVFGATECGTDHPTAEQCVNFSEPFLVLWRSYSYKTTLEKGDRIGVFATTPFYYQSCSGTVSLSTLIYVDGILVESDIDDGSGQGDNCQLMSSCQTTI